jgi:hypothetical protein
MPTIIRKHEERLLSKPEKVVLSDMKEPTCTNTGTSNAKNFTGPTMSILK